jgi:IS4 transposase
VYHTFLTNIRVDILSAEEIAVLYGARWEIERLFKELKSHYRMDQIPSANPNIVKCEMLDLDRYSDVNVLT